MFSQHALTRIQRHSFCAMESTATGLHIHLELMGRPGEISQIGYGYGVEKRIYIFYDIMALTHTINTTTVSIVLSDYKQGAFAIGAILELIKVNQAGFGLPTMNFRRMIVASKTNDDNFLKAAIL